MAASRSAWRTSEPGAHIGFYQRLGFMPTGELDENGEVMCGSDCPRRSEGAHYGSILLIVIGGPARARRIKTASDESPT